jgi:hypothetical protein
MKNFHVFTWTLEDRNILKKRVLFYKPIINGKNLEATCDKYSR